MKDAAEAFHAELRANTDRFDKLCHDSETRGLLAVMRMRVEEIPDIADLQLRLKEDWQSIAPEIRNAYDECRAQQHEVWVRIRAAGLGDVVHKLLLAELRHSMENMHNV